MLPPVARYYTDVCLKLPSFCTLKLAFPIVVMATLQTLGNDLSYVRACGGLEASASKVTSSHLTYHAMTPVHEKYRCLHVRTHLKHIRTITTIYSTMYNTVPVVRAHSTLSQIGNPCGFSSRDPACPSFPYPSCVPAQRQTSSLVTLPNRHAPASSASSNDVFVQFNSFSAPVSFSCSSTLLRTCMCV